MVQTVEDIMGKNLPEKKYKAGAISATIWKNDGSKDGKPFSYRTISVQRSYKDSSGEWKHTTQFRPADIPKLTLVLNKAYEYIVTMDGDE